MCDRSKHRLLGPGETEPEGLQGPTAPAVPLPLAALPGGCRVGVGFWLLDSASGIPALDPLCPQARPPPQVDRPKSKRFARCPENLEFAQEE